MSWEAWAQCMLRTVDNTIAAVECGIYSFEGDCWYSSNEALEKDVITKLLSVFNSNVELTSIVVRGSKYFFIRTENNVIGFKKVNKTFVAAKANNCILVSEGEEPNTPIGSAFEAASHTSNLLDNVQYDQDTHTGASM